MLQEEVDSVSLLHWVHTLTADLMTMCHITVVSNENIRSLIHHIDWILTGVGGDEILEQPYL